MAKKASGNPIRKMYDKFRGAKRETIPTGEYVIQWKTLSLVLEDEKPNARLNGVVQRGEHKGTNVSKYYQFFDRTANSGTEMKGEDDMERFMLDLAALGFDTTDIDPEDLPGEIKETKPVSKTKVKQNGDYNNFNIIGLVESEDDDDDDESEVEEEEEEEEGEETKPSKKPKGKVSKKDKEEEEEEEEGEEEEQEEEEETEEEEEEEEEAVEPAKGMKAMYKAKGARKPSVYNITAVNTKKRTATLVSLATGAKVENVSWDDFEAEADDDDE